MIAKATSRQIACKALGGADGRVRRTLYLQSSDIMSASTDIQACIISLVPEDLGAGSPIECNDVLVEKGSRRRGRPDDSHYILSRKGIPTLFMGQYQEVSKLDHHIEGWSG
jgi:hypothetical protein